MIRWRSEIGRSYIASGASIANKPSVSARAATSRDRTVSRGKWTTISRYNAEMSPNFLRSALVVFWVISAIPGWAQNRALTADDYAHAEKFMGYNTGPLMLRAVSRVTWLSDNQIRYRITTEKGNEFLLIDVARGTRQATTEDQARSDARSVLSPDSKRAAFIK